MSQRQKLIPALLCLVLFYQSCSHGGIVMPFPHSSPPVYGPLLPQTPFQTFLDSVLSLKDTTVSYALDEIPMWDRFAQIKGQALIGYCFRSSKAGEVTALGILLPGQGYSHNVSLWDSVTYQVLADVNVPNLNTKKFTYVSLALLNKSVDIQPNHPYIVCFNSLAQGSPLNFASRGNNIYQLHAEILNPFVATTPLVIPFTSGAITFESDFIVTYNSIYVPNPALVGESTNDQRVFGICDIGFMSK